MNHKKLTEAEHKFLQMYPRGFSHPEMLEIAKKHKILKMQNLVKESFSIEQFESAEKIVESMNKVVSQSSMVSLFEKPKFRDFIKSISYNEKEFLANGIKEFLHGKDDIGFKQMTSLLAEYKIAKWPLLTIVPVYFRPDTEVFVKPTTAKGIIAHFELTDLKYQSQPTFEFYKEYRTQINQMKALVHPSLQVDNAAFCGFLMMTMD